MTTQAKVRKAELLVLEVAAEFATYIQDHIFQHEDDGPFVVAPATSPEACFLEAVEAMKALQDARHKKRMK